MGGGQALEYWRPTLVERRVNKTIALVSMICAGAALAAGGDARAEDWRPFFVVPGGVIMLDHDSVSLGGGRVTARLESTFPKPQGLSRNGRIYAYVKTIDRVEVDCAAAVYRNISRDLYGKDGLEALSINEADNPQMVAKGSAQAAMITAYCRK